MRGLTEKEWNSAGTRILILEHIARIENELSELDKYRSQYHEKDKESAVLRQKLRQATAVDLLFDFALAAGGTLVGLSTFLFDKSQWILGLVVLLIGLIFFISPLVLKYYQKGD